MYTWFYEILNKLYQTLVLATSYSFINAYPIIRIDQKDLTNSSFIVIVVGSKSYSIYGHNSQLFARYNCRCSC